MKSPKPSETLNSKRIRLFPQISERRTIERGGYETWTSNGSKLVPEALDMIVDGSVEVLKGLFGR